MVVDDAGRFVSQRTDPKMCLIHPKVRIPCQQFPECRDPESMCMHSYRRMEPS